MSKRRSETVIDRDAVDQDDQDQDVDAQGTWKAASQDKLAKRVIVKGKRSVSTAESTADSSTPAAAASTTSKLPTFNLFPTTTPAAAASAASASATTSDSTSTTSKGFAPLLIMQPAGSWKCDSCWIQNPASAEKCKACTADKPASAKSAATVEKKAEEKPAVAIAAQEKPATSGWGNLFLKPGQWRCSVCSVSNDEKVEKCISCTTPKPQDKKAAAPAAPAASTTPAAAPAFVFNAAKTDSSASTGFKFAPLGSTSTAPTFVFNPTGSSNSSSTTTPAFNPFGASAGFSAHASGTTSFATAAAKNTSSKKEEEEEEADEEAGDDSVFEKKDSLDTSDVSTKAELAQAVKDKKHEQSGEETDRVLLKVRTKLYRVAKSESKDLVPTECGIGELHVNEVNTDGAVKYRLLLRQEKTNKLLLNSLLHSNIKTSKEQNAVRFSTIEIDPVTQKEQPAGFIFKIKDAAECQSLFNLITEKSGVKA